LFALIQKAKYFFEHKVKKQIKKILVPTDFSELSFVALPYAETFAEMFDAEIILLHVIDSDPTLAYRTVDLKSETVLRNFEINAEKELMRMRKERIASTCNVTEIVRRGNSHKEIVMYANEHSIDLIIVATHGRTGLSHILMGSVVEKVIRHSVVPVLTVKPSETQEPFMENENW